MHARPTRRPLKADEEGVAGAQGRPTTHGSVLTAVVAVLVGVVLGFDGVGRS